MHVIIAGAGTLGTALVQRLVRSKNEVSVIDMDKGRCDELFASTGCETICGNATSLPALKAAGIEKADMVVATIRNDAANLAFSVLAKSHDIKEIIVRMNNKEYREAYNVAGATQLLSVVDSLVDDILYWIEKPDIQPIARLGDGAVEIFSVNVPEDGKVAGKTISELAKDKRLPEDSVIIGVFDKEKNTFKVPRGNTMVSGASQLFVVTKPELVKKTGRFLMS